MNPINHTDTPETAGDTAPRKRRGPVRRKPQPLALEARLMFDGAAVATAAAAEALPEVQQDAPAPSGNTEATPPPPMDASIAATEVVFVDSGVTNWEQLIGGMRDNVQIVILESGHDGLSQIADVLSGITNLDAIHIISHGSEGSLQLAGSSYTAANIDASRAQLESIGSALAAHGDILLYGCDIGMGSAGATLIEAIAAITSADVAASSNDTGSADRGGDWVLEEQTGTIDASALMIAETDYSGILALPGAHVASNSSGLFLGGNYIELGIRTNNQIGKFGADIAPGGAFTGRNGQSGIGMVGDADGFGSGAALNIDYFMPGSPEEGFYAGYNGNVTGKNFATSVTNTSSGDTLSALVSGTIGGTLKVDQAISFQVNDKYFKNVVTITNVSGSSISQVRFMRSFDPDNTVDRGGSYSTTQTIERSMASGDSMSVVSATAGADSYATASGGNRAKILYYTSDARAAVSFGTSGLAPSGIYDTRVYNSAPAKGSSITTDAYMSIAVNVGTLAAGQSTTFTYFTSLDNRDINTIVNEIAAADNKAFQPINEDAGNHAGQTVSSVFGSAVAITGINNTNGLWQYSSNGSTWSNISGVSNSSGLLLGTGYSVRFVPNADWHGSSSLSYKVWNGSGYAAGNTVDTGSTTYFSANAANATITVNSVNDAPVLGGASASLNYAEGQGARVIDSGITLTDADSPASFNGGWLDVRITANGQPADQLVVLNQGSSAGQISLGGSGVYYAGTLIGTRDVSNSGTNGSALRINLNTNASLAAVQALARAVAYYSTSDDPSESARSVTFRLNDGGNTGSGGAKEGTKTASIAVTAYNPTELALNRSSATYLENATDFFVDPALTLTPRSDSQLSGARVVIGAGFRPSEDTLSGVAMHGITFSYDAVRGILTASGTATVAQYQDALRSVRYTNSSDNPNITPRTITFTLGNVVALTTPDGKNHYYEVFTGSYSWTEAKALAESKTYQGLTGYLATITSQAENDFIRDKLSADAWMGASDDYSYINAATGALTFANQAAAEGKWYWVTGPEAGTLISTGNSNPITPSGGYANWNSGEPNNYQGTPEHYGQIYSTGGSLGRWNDLQNSSALGYVVEYSDNGGTSVFSKSVTVTPQRVNDAPNASGTVVIAAISEDAVNNSGSLVSSFLSATDVDGAAVSGIAITSLASGNGTWQYSTNNGATWTEVGAVSDGSALLLSTTDRVRFVPDGSNAETVSISYRAWDGTNSATAGTKRDVSAHGGSTAYSSDTQQATLSVTAVNDAPTLSPASPTLLTLSEDDTANAGQTIASIVGSSITDVDAGASEGIAITSLNNGNGNWQYSINAGSTWINVGTVSASSALLLRASDSVRFLPDGKNATTASFSYKAWDTTSGAAGTKANASTGGGTSAFSTTSDTASITVSAVNDAPVLSGAALTLNPIDEDDTGNTGQTVGSFLGSALSDVDSGAAGGIAITGATVLGSGKWQYDSGSGWTDLPVASNTAAVLLRTTDKVRYVPDTYQGGTASLTVRGWDTSSGVPGGTADTTSNGGTSAFSTATATASIAVREINDAPTITTAASDATFSEAATGTPASESSAVTVGSGIIINDDGGTLSRATVTIRTGFTLGDVLAVATPGGINVAYNDKTGVLTLSGNASVAVYQTALQSVTFKSTSDDPTVRSTTRTLGWAVYDADNVENSASGNDNNTVTVTPTQDAPTITAAPSTWQYYEDDGPRIVAPGIQLADADDTHLNGASIVLAGAGYVNDGRETLSASVTGTSINASFDVGTGILSLTGIDSVANYQRVLRSVTYLNSRDYDHYQADGVTLKPDAVDLDGTNNKRTFTWSVTDANSDSAGPAVTVMETVVTILNANEDPMVEEANQSFVEYVEGGGAVPVVASSILTIDGNGISGAEATITKATVAIGAGLALGDVLNVANDSHTEGYTHIVTGMPNALIVNVTGPEVLTISELNGLLPLVEYKLTIAGTVLTVTTDAEPTLAKLLAGLKADSDYASAPFTLSADQAGDKLVVTNKITGAIDADASLTANNVPTGAFTKRFDNATLSGTYDANTGVLTLIGEASMAAYQSVLRSVTYDTTSDDPTASSNQRTIKWQIWSPDTTGALGDGGVPIIVPSAINAESTTTVRLEATNDAPIVTTVIDPYTYIENGPAILANPGIVLGDPDDTNATGATIAIGGIGFDAAKEYLGFAGITPATGSMLANTDWTATNLYGTGIGASYLASTGILTLSGPASIASYESVLRQVTYANASDHPTSGGATRTLTWTLTDDFGSRLTDFPGDNDSSTAKETGTATSTLTLSPRNDAPTIAGTAGTATYTEGAPAAVLAGGITLADVDDANIASARVWISGGFTAGDILTPTPGATGIDTSYDAATGILTLSKTGGATLADFQSVLRTVTFSSTSDNPTASSPTRTIAWQIVDANAAGDGALASTVAYSQVDLVAVDNAASLAGLPANGSISFTENGSSVLVAPSATLSDADDTQLAGVTVTLGSPQTGDLLSVGANLSGTGITVTAYDPGTGVLALSGLASLADFERAVRSIAFSSSSEHPTAGGNTRTLSWTTTSASASLLTDALPGNDSTSGAISTATSSQVSVTGLNDAGTVVFSDNTALDGDTTVFQQGSAPVFAVGSQTGASAGSVTYTDPDDSQLAGATVVISENRLVSDVLSVARPTGWGGTGNTYSFGSDTITTSYNASTGTLTFSGSASIASYNTLLAHVQYQNTSTAPTASGATRELTWTLTDANATGDGAKTSVQQTYLTIRDLNDAPMLAGIANVDYTEGDLSVALPNLVVSDPDPDEVLTATLTLSNPSIGELTKPAGVSYTVATGIWTLTGTVAEVNAALAAVRFVPTIDNDVQAQINVTIADGGEDAVPAATGTIMLNVIAVNDAPLLTPSSLALSTITEDDVDHAGFLVSSFRGASTDVDSGTSFGVAITELVVGNGHWEYSLDGGTNWTAVGAVSETNALLLRDADKIRFVPDAKNGTNAALTYRTWDRSAGTAGGRADASANGNATPFSTATDTASLVVTSVNDAPHNTVAPLLDVSNGQRLDTSLKHLGEIMGDTGEWADVDIGAITPLYRFQWQVADDASGTNVTDIPGGTNLSYVISPDYVGKFVRLRVFATDGIAEGAADSNFISITNTDPVATMPLSSQQTMESVPITFAVPVNAFFDPDVVRGEDAFTYRAELADGTALPSWLTFDPITLTFSGTPSGADVGDISITVWASDGGNFPASITFTLRVIALPVNPPAPAPLPDAAPRASDPAAVFLSPTDPSQGAYSAGDGSTPGTVPVGDVPGTGSGIGIEPLDGGILSPFAGSTFNDGFTGTMDAGTGLALTFAAPATGESGNAPTTLGTFGGILTSPGEGAFRIVVTESDQPALLLFRGVPDQQLQSESGLIEIQIPADAFTHTNPQATVTLEILLANDLPLPAWLSFDPVTGKLIGRPPEGLDEDLEIKVIARDADGREAVTTFRIKLDRGAVQGRLSLSEQIRLASRQLGGERISISLRDGSRVATTQRAA